MAQKEQKSAAEQKRESKDSKKQETAEKDQTLTIALIIIAVLVVSVAVGYIVRESVSSNSESFAQFQHNYLGSPRVAIVESNYNATALPAVITCGDSLVEGLTSNRQYHRNSSTIDFYVLNYTGCTYERGLGNATTKPVSQTGSQCLDQIGDEPSIFINYSSHNMTTVQGNRLYTSGDLLFLTNCGIASEIG